MEMSNPTLKYMTETGFANLVIELAQWHGWRVVHFRPARTAHGWRTTFQGDYGFPDLVLARAGTVLLVELKTVHGRLGRGQQEWADHIGGDLYRLWRPTDFEAIKEELRTGQRAA